jgi:cytochrome c oxidase assembly protein subunit 15
LFERLDTGRAYNTFPLMDGKIAPVDDMFTMEPTWRNFFENTATVQVISTVTLYLCG